MIYFYYVYIFTNQRNTVLYVGITNNLLRRVSEHKSGKGSIFTKKYNINKLLYFELYDDPENAIKREKQIKNYSRKKKEELINQKNPEWQDMSNNIIM